MNNIYRIQELRAIAALVVTISHFNFTLNFLPRFNGSIGVDIFFIISGFIMNHILSTKENNPFSFISNRFKRIYPLYSTITLILGALLLLKNNLNYGLLLKSLFFIPFGVYTWNDPILVPGWTLIFELIFYIIIALSLYFKNIKFIYIWFVLIALINVSNFRLNFSILKILFTTLNIEFIIGFCLYTFYFYLKKISIKYINIFFLIYLFLFIFLMFNSTDNIKYFNLIPRDTVSYNGLFFSRFLIWGLPSALFVTIFLLTTFKPIPLFIKLGDISYSIYLLQYLLLGVFNFIITKAKINLHSLNIFTKLSLLISFLFLLIGLSKLSYKFVEKNLIFK